MRFDHIKRFNAVTAPFNFKVIMMKPNIHPEYKEVVFLDVSNNFSFKTRSTMNTRETIKWEDGKEYPLAKIETSSESHPFYTGTQKIMDTAGRVEKFRQKFGAKAGAKASVKE
jgi:large subunit ribosomal protein L31